MSLVDSHCHLDFPAFEEDFDAVMSRAANAGIGTMVTICTHLSRFDNVLAIARAHDDVYCTVGVHPHEAEEEGIERPDRLIALAQDENVIGIGETGLDYYYEHSPRNVQRQSFRAHITAARETGLPLIVHTRDADEDTTDILRKEYAKGPFLGVIHCFSASRQLAEDALDLGMYISISGIATFKQADELRDTIRGLPLDRLLVETDAPYLAPVPMRGRRNEPAFVAHTTSFLAELLGVDPAELGRITTENFFRLFGKAQRPAAPAA